MLPWLGRLPLTVRLPLVVALLMVVIATAVTQFALQSYSRQFERQIARVGDVYLDGLSSAVLPYFRAGDQATMERVLRRALSFHTGVMDRRLLLFGSQGESIVRADRADIAMAAAPETVFDSERGLVFDESGSSIWVWRPLIDEEGLRLEGKVVANLDASGFLHDRETLRWQLLALGTLTSVLGAVLGFLIARRIQRPLDLLAQHLHDATRLGAHSIPIDERATDPQATRLFLSFNQMVEAAAEREGLLASLARQEREAVLGRLSATLAHEIRNPLGGLSAAIQTLRKYGDQPSARAEALDFMDRGVRALGAVVDATLKMHRPDRPGRTLRQQDMLDMGTLVRAEARTRSVTVDIRADLPEHVAVGASEVRQVVLNLLLNAVHASPAGGTVSLLAGMDGATLRILIEDQGPGMDPALARSLEGGSVPIHTPGLGVSVIVTLMAALQGSIAVELPEGCGTRVVLRIPQVTDIPLS